MYVGRGLAQEAKEKNLLVQTFAEQSIVGYIPRRHTDVI